MFTLRRIRPIALLVVTGAMLLATLSFLSLQGAGNTASSTGARAASSVPCQPGGHMVVDGKCLQVAHNEALSPTASAALAKALATPAGQEALQKVLRKIPGAKIGMVVEPSLTAYVKPSWNCPGGSACGISGSGGTHFWFIASYASIYDVGAFPFWLACTGALSPVIDPIAATAACGAVTGIIWALVNNAPWTTRHGVWMAVYWNHISDGYW
ncbi:MAG: hypothetical protein M0030_20710 [Actinomycetota bacterium]|nr:hypothetical protein [Actinomycetota bacterium]